MYQILKKIAGGLLLLTVLQGVKAQSGYKILKHFSIQSGGGWDYILSDPSSSKLYVSHGVQVNILDKNSGDSLGVIAGTNGVHGIALVHATGKGYTSNGRLNNVSVFDLTTNQVLKQIATGQNPDAIFYDGFSKKIVVCNGRSQDLTIIDAATDAVVATIPVGGKPETAVSDGAGKLYVNIEDKSQIAVVDVSQYTVLNHWSVAPGESPSGLAIDRENQKLFAGCDNKMLVVVDCKTGKVAKTLPIGDGCDGVAFDAQLANIFSSNGEGTLTIIHQVSATEYKTLENLTTQKSARTLSLDPTSHLIYLPAADIAPSQKSGERPTIIPGTFRVLVVGK